MSSDPLPVPPAGRDPLHRLHFSFLHLAAVLPALIVFRWPSDHPAVVAGLVALQGYVLFCWTSYFHECAHQALPGRTRARSIADGRILGTLIGVPYTAYRETHVRHHAYLNTPSDWELWPYSDPGRSRAFRRVFVWLDLLAGMLTQPVIYGRIAFHRDSPLSPAARRAVRVEYVAILVFWSAVLGVVAWGGWWPEFLLAWVAPVWLAGMLQSGRKLTEHLGMAAFDPLLGTRTVVGGGVLTRVSSFLNFRIFVHGLHHRHPQLPHLELEGKMGEYRARNPDVSYPVYGSYGAAVWAMLPSLFRNPGCGVNAGTPAPHGPPPDVSDFAPEGADLPPSAGGEPARPVPLHAPAGTVTGLSQVHSASVNEPPATVSSR